MAKFPSYIIDRWHLEITSKCTLACPRCVRVVESPNTPYSGVDIDVEKLYSFFTDDVLDPVWRISFVGNYGDPIYHPQFHEIISFFKSKNKRLSITTNGFGRSEKWWIELMEILDNTDILEFSIDGLKDTNHIYRINSQWDSVMTGLKTACRYDARILWKYIVFKHNQHQIDEAIKTASDIGVDEFELVRSNRWDGNDDYLMPNKKWTNINWSTPKTIEKIQKKIIEPRCLSGNPHFINAHGIYTPCCWISIYDKTNPFYNHFDIGDNSLEEILSSKKIIEFEQSLCDFETSNITCKQHCSKTSREFSEGQPSIDSSRTNYKLKNT